MTMIGDASAIPAVVAIPDGIAKRQCFGDLFLTEDALYFVCYADRLALGSSTPTLMNSIEVRNQLKGAPLDQAMAQSRYSRRFAVPEIKEFKKAFWTGQAFTAGGSRYQFVHGLGAKERGAVRSWCEAHQVPCPGF